MTRFILLTTQRSGSTYICRLLHNHPEIAMYGEVFLNTDVPGGFKIYAMKESNYKILYNIFNLKYVKKIHSKIPFYFPVNTIAKRYLDNLYSRDKDYINQNNHFNDEGNLLLSDPEAIGFKLMVNQVYELPYLKQWLSETKPKIILLKRNIINRYLSNACVKLRGISHSKEEVEQVKFTADIDDFKEFFKASMKQYGYFKTVKESCETIEISYEDFFAHREGNLGKLLEFIGVEQNLSVEWPKLKKLNSLKPSEMVKNFEELVTLESKLHRKYCSM